MLKKYKKLDESTSRALKDGGKIPGVEFFFFFCKRGFELYLKQTDNLFHFWHQEQGVLALDFHYPGSISRPHSSSGYLQKDFFFLLLNSLKN